MSAFRRTTLTVIFASAMVLRLNGGAAVQDSHTRDLDPAIKPGDDFYNYANGGWLQAAAIPEGQELDDTRALLMGRTNQRVADLMRETAAGRSEKGSAAQKVGDYYSSFIDVDAIEAKGMAPLAKELARVSAIENSAALSSYLGSTLNTEVDGLTSSADHVFGVFVNQSFEQSQRYRFHLLQGGLGLSDRDAYLDSSPKRVELRQQYQAHIAAILRLAGLPGADANAPRVLSLESRIAQAHAPDADAADVFKQNNPWKRGDFAVKAPGIDWRAYFAAAGASDQSEFIVWQPSAVTGVAALVAGEDIEAWKAYLEFHLIEHYAAVLPRAVAAEDFAFYGTTMSGQHQMPDRASGAVAATNAALGQAVGQLYTRRYFPPAAKAQAKRMVADLIAAYRARLSRVAWMSAATRRKALAKLAAFRIGVGYPDAWIDYSTLDIVRGDAFGNFRRAEAFNRSQNIDKLRRAADPDEWRIDPQMVAAVILFSPNTETFAAGLLQPPYFDPDGDAASNYGSAGAGIAHEITHSFDELGNIYDDHGRLRRWWTAEDLAGYRAASAKLEAQLAGYCPQPDLCVNGKRVLAESAADLAGLEVAHDAYVLSLKGTNDVVIGGLTGEQRFFVAFAQRWRRKQTEASLRRQLATDTHLPPQYRSDAVRNLDAWYSAYQVASGDKLFVEPAARVSIW